MTETDWLMTTSATALKEQLDSGALTEAALRDASLQRTRALNTSLGAVITLDPGAVSSGEGALKGLPVLLKDNIDAAGMPTTAGSLALADNLPPDDAFLTARLRESGAVLLGKANLSEWANFRSTRSISGWSAAGGQARNPHALDRSPCGSSSGSAVAVAAGLAPLAVGTETDGSILCPASVNGVVGVKPTVGLVSRDGVVPISPTQDTPGPLARTVADAALLLEVLAGHDPDDPAPRPPDLATDYRSGLSADALKGAVLGVPQGLETYTPGATARFQEALADLERLGATVVEVSRPVDSAVYETEWEVLLAEFGPALEAYLADNPGSVKTLADLIAFNAAHEAEEMPWFDQNIFSLAAEATLDDALIARREAAREALGADWIDALIAEHALDALVLPTFDPAWLIDPVLGDRTGGNSTSYTAIPGYPAVTVPMGRVRDLPVGISFIGGAWTEARLLALAYAYEQGTHHAAPPLFRETLPGP